MTRELLNVSIKQIYSFLTAAKYGNFTTAAEILFTSQTSISRNISALEQQFGVMLFYRHSGGVELTSMGKSLYADWVEQLESMEHSAAALKQQARSNKAQLVLADFSNIPAEIYLLPLLNEFSRVNPDINLQIHRITMPDIIEGVRTKRFDAAFTSDPGVEIFKDAGYDLIKVKDIEANLMVSKDNPAVADGIFDASKLRGQPLVVMRRSRIEDFDRNLFERIRGIAEKNNIEVGEVQFVESPHSMYFKLIRENCWTILNKLDYGGLEYIQLPDKFEYFLGINQKQIAPEIKHFARFANRLYKES